MKLQRNDIFYNKYQKNMVTELKNVNQNYVLEPKKPVGDRVKGMKIFIFWILWN